MKKLIIALCLILSVTTTATATEKNHKDNTTSLVWEDSKGNKHEVYKSEISDRYYILKRNKDNGKLYRLYLQEGTTVIVINN